MIAPEVVFGAEFGTLMMKLLLKILLLALAIVAAPQALAGKFDIRGLLGHVEGVDVAYGEDGRKVMMADSNGPTLSEAKRMVQQRCQCRIVDAWTQTSAGREVHHIKFMTKDGTVKTERISGRSKQP